MGAVYQAKDLKRQTTCAIKEMSLSMVPPEERSQAIQNFKIEADILRKLNHPYLPSFHGFFAERQRYFLVMEFIDGLTLEEMLEREGRPFPERRVLGWARQLCDVLQYLHDQQPPIIFRDMKPGNVMRTRDGRIKLIDFGIARIFRPMISQDTQILGTPGFAPPEQYGKAQTDERSDIYSLAMTLFQLLTNTLSETGFGLEDVRAINPHISPMVARALEKATAMRPEDRYDSVVAFRRALLGEGTFVFENGDQATTPDELADLCARYPEEASDYLFDGEIELWLHEIGEVELERVARQIRMMINDPAEALEQFLLIMDELVEAHQHGYSATHTSHGQAGTATPARPVTTPHWQPPRKPTSPVQVSPRTLDFGQVYPGISAPMAITIRVAPGLACSGDIYANESWILLDETRFDGEETYVNVRINSTKLQGSAHYTGTVVISPDEGNTRKDIIVTVEADIIVFSDSSNPQVHSKLPAVADDFDEEEDEDALTEGALLAVPPLSQAQVMVEPVPEPPQSVEPAKKTTGKPAAAPPADQAQSSKYAKGSGGWDPLPPAVRQKRWFQYGRTFIAALMTASLVYTLLAPLSPSHTAPLPPDPWFVLVLAGMVPVATLGTLIAKWPGKSEAINRACTGMGGTLFTLAIARFAWQLLIHESLAPLQFFLLLLIAASSATAGTAPAISDQIIYGVSWVLARTRRRLGLTLAVIVGASLGYLLTVGFAISWLTLCSLVIGIATTAGLVWRIDQLMKQMYP
ncbi:serine/threonine protein kinase [Ktedonosporobacter rubrisoli]|uniref:Serine/threonine protein kinase n=2 Tax=Ktedonosporobacter rubrisoli TaxID=2509675 RepID=A0A4P6JXF7_KTERU|nr:serine/threonine protein kinase [Ktedonosporobacter rubrisoli]